MKASNVVIFIALVLNTVSFSVQAQVNAKEVGSMISQFKEKGILNDEQAGEAMKKMEGMSPEQWDKLNKVAGDHQAQAGEGGRAPASNDVDYAAKNIDTESAEFKSIQSDVENAMKK